MIRVTEILNAKVTERRGTSFVVSLSEVAPMERYIAFQLLRESKEKRNGYIYLKVGLPRKPRSTGEGSQNHLINGCIQYLAEQTGEDFDVLKYWIKRRAIKRGYPYHNLPDGSVEPYSEKDISTEEATFLYDEIVNTAAEYFQIIDWPWERQQGE